MKKTTVLAGSMAGAAAAFFAVPAMVSAAPNTPAPAAGPLKGKTVFLDAAGSGGGVQADLTRQVPDGRGGTVACSAPSAATASGVADHTINYNVARMVESALTSQGAKVVMGRSDDTGFAGCVDARANAASASKADIGLVVNTVSQDPSLHGFTLETPAAGVSDQAVSAAQSGAGAKAANVVRDAGTAAGLAPADYLGSNKGIAQTQNAYVSQSSLPLVYADLGNVANTGDASALGTKAGQAKYAVALTNGLIQYLTGKVTPAGAVAQPIKSEPLITIPQPTAPTAGTTAAPAAGTGASTVQTPIVPSLPGAASTAAPTASAPQAATGQTTGGTSPIVSGVPMLSGGPTASTNTGTAAQTAAPAQPATTNVDIPGLGSLQVPALPQFVQAPQLTSMIQQLTPQAQQFVSSSAGQQMISSLFTNPQSLNSLAASQGPGVAQQVIKAVLSGSSMLPGI
ncbi:N-acetylmuramoyl-L-alanine amidase [Tsukamurella sp. 8F]|uniref:N-acetylmuramoyl-L-alanine amidase family protein n=1 Tax=unclassified Tsukamurella TaxID=2633480 RepID=UPI0023B97E75|nr:MULTISPECIES: N-acetylmuramoyl-L-alanine amidase [unclassified Tsukamurella]MDF0529716.1 N-acetylmuramoyl-L-alanine amidase [Tsukamurella sp. 8J]MDF0586001.1 N-acetylmuramoyl-L-alanine amidase [Tsukamurella sp. 8F]